MKRIILFILILLCIVCICYATSMFFSPGKDKIQYVDFLSPLPLDEHTVLLMRFDRDLVNESQLSEDASYQGRIEFVQGLHNFGQAAWIDNSMPGDSSMIIVPHNEALNLKTSFTIEGWSKNISFDQAGYGATVSRTPWILRKGTTGGGHDFAYALTVNPFTRSFDATSVYKDWGPHVRIRNEKWNRLVTKHHSIELDVWYHFTFIKDYDNHAKILLIHDTEGNLYQWGAALAPSDTTDYNDEPLFFGLCNISRQNEGVFYWNGYLDEVRISDIVRNYNAPPIIGNIKIDCEGHNPRPYESVQLEAEIRTIGSNVLDGLPVLHYNIGDGNWREMKMQQGTTPHVYISNIPGQAKGSKVTYYITAKNQEGLTGRYPHIYGEYSAIGYWEELENTLYITFEEGPSGFPCDYSFYDHQIKIIDNVSYSNDVAPALRSESKWSLAINMDVGEENQGSSGIYIPGPTPFINGEYDAEGDYGWTVDFWFKVDPTFNFKPGLESQQYAGMTLMYTGNLTSQDPGSLIQRIDVQWDNHILMRCYTPHEHLRLEVPGLTNSGKWFHAVIGETRDFYFAKFYNENDSPLVHNTWSKSEFRESYDPPYSLKPFIIGHSWTDNNFRGWIDDIKWYNYAKYD